MNDFQRYSLPLLRRKRVAVSCELCYTTYFIFWILSLKAVNLRRYPENNLFTLKKLIPIENWKGGFLKSFLFFVSIATDSNGLLGINLVCRT